MTSMQSKIERKGKKRKKEKPIGSKPDPTIIHVSFRKEKDVEMYQMRWRKLDFNHHHQQPFFMCKKTKNIHMTKQQ
jgi:hypothetical protein